MAYLLQFGTYVLPPTLYVADVNLQSQVPTAKMPRADGSRVAQGYLEKLTFTVQGMLKAGYGGLPLRDQLDALKAATASGPANFQMQSDRYYRNCQRSTWTDSYEATWRDRFCNVRFEIVTGDPFGYSANVVNSLNNSVTLTGDPVNFAVGGNAYAMPKIILTVGGSATGTFNGTLTNVTTGESCTLNAANLTPGTTITLDTLNEQILVGVVLNMSIFDGVFPRFAPGNNTLRCAWGQLPLRYLDASWQNRWW